MTVTPERPAEFVLCLRIPVWARGKPTAGDLYRYADETKPPVTVKVNGEPVPVGVDPADGYLHLERTWRSGDTVEINLPMPIRRVVADPRVEACRGKTALMRGPLVYCLEGADHPDVDVLTLALPESSELRARYRPDLLNGVAGISSRAVDAAGREVPLTAVPYYAWANRERGAMTVWIHRR
jgi:DUF1680 family protein